jgi:hypothetical protein
MNLLKKIPFFLLLLPLFFCLHGWFENYGFIRVDELLIPGLEILGCLLMFTAVVYLFAGNLVTASLIVFFISLWYLFFGALHDAVKSLPFLSCIKSYTAMLIILVIVSLVWIIFVKRKKTIHPKLVLYLNLLLLVYCSVDALLLIKDRFTVSTISTVDQINFDPAKVTKKPDVFLLLFDGYPGFASLKDSFNFSNERLQNYFTANSFKILPVFANYDHTYFCMASMFNMQYVKKDFDNLNVTQRDFQKRGVEINHGAIFPLFKAMGYKTENLSIFEIDDEPAKTGANSFLLAHSILLTDKILHNRIKRDIGDRVGKIIPFWKDLDFYQHAADNKKIEGQLLASATTKTPVPKFVYAHFMMPHGPYYFDSLGNKNPYEKISHYTMWKDKGLFISYIKYINKKLINMVDTLVAHNPDAIIIVMGDHGFRSLRSNELIKRHRYDNLCAVRFPDDGHKVVRDKWSTVNLFRYIFNCQFGQNIPYLADSTIVLGY